MGIKMKYIRIRSYLPDGTFTGCEHAFIGDDQVSATKRFRNEYPEHADCTVVVETIDDQDPDWKEWFRIARNCGCVHCFN
jgi:hypothetical protein